MNKPPYLKPVSDFISGQVPIHGRFCQLEDVVGGPPDDEPVPGLGPAVVLVHEAAGAVRKFDVLKGALGPS